MNDYFYHFLPSDLNFFQCAHIVHCSHISYGGTSELAQLCSVNIDWYYFEDPWITTANVTYFQFLKFGDIYGKSRSEVREPWISNRMH